MSPRSSAVFAVNILTAVCVAASAQRPIQPIDWVNEAIGIGSGGIGYGGTMPFVAAPFGMFGMTDWTAQTPHGPPRGGPSR